IRDLTVTGVQTCALPIFLLFMIGLELSWERLMRMRKLVFGLGPLQVVVSAIALALVAFALGQTPAAASVLGGALALSSTAIVLRSEERRVGKERASPCAP